jgi:hypothetical protein
MVDKVTIAGKEYEVLLKDDHYIQFILYVEKREDHSIKIEVLEVTSWSTEKEPLDAETYLNALMKWDGCCHVWMGRKKDKSRDGYLHLCGVNCWKNHIKMMEALYKYAEKNIKSFDHGFENWDG